MFLSHTCDTDVPICEACIGYFGIGDIDLFLSEILVLCPIASLIHSKLSAVVGRSSWQIT